MYISNFNILFLSVSLLFEFIYNYLINRKVIFDFNKILKIATIRKIQLIIIVLLILNIILNIFFIDILGTYLPVIDMNDYLKTDFQIPYFIYLPLIFIGLINFNTNSTAISEYGISMRKVKNGLITWGQISSITYIDDFENEICDLSVNYIDRDSQEDKNRLIRFKQVKKYEIESTLNYMTSRFKQEDYLPYKHYLLIKKISLGLLFISLIILFFTGDIIF